MPDTHKTAWLIITYVVENHCMLCYSHGMVKKPGNVLQYQEEKRVLIVLLKNLKEILRGCVQHLLVMLSK